jgi:hypothetical protein
MFRILASVPGRLKNLFSYFKPYFTKPQFDNFCRAEMGLIGAGKKEHDIVSMNKLFMDRKDQSSLNRFFTNAKWALKGIADVAKEIFLGEAAKQPPAAAFESVEHRSVDDTVCRKYSSKTEMACYNYSSTMGRVLSHDFVTSIYQNGQTKIPDNIKLYGSKKKCQEKGVEFKTKIQLACEIIDEHVPLEKETIMYWDSWYMCKDPVEHCKARHYRWIGEVKSNRIVFYQNERLHLYELFDRLREEGRFVDAVVDGEIYQVCKVNVFIPDVGNISVLINAKADTHDFHMLCTDLSELTVMELVEQALKRHAIEEFHKEAKALGLGEYKFQQSEAALIHAHLVCVALILLDVLRRRLLRYGIKKSLMTMAATVDWVVGQAGDLFVHAIRNSNLLTRSLLRMINTK